MLSSNILNYSTIAIAHDKGVISPLGMDVATRGMGCHSTWDASRITLKVGSIAWKVGNITWKVGGITWKGGRITWKGDRITLTPPSFYFDSNSL